MVDFLARGVMKFKREGFRKNCALFRKLAKSQSPRIPFVTCADSRIVPQLITRTRPGDLFVERNPGNIVPIRGTHAWEGAASVLEVEHVVVCGRSDCGAVKGMLHQEKLSAVPEVKRWLACSNRSPQMLARRARGLSEERQLELHGWVHRIHDGEILQLHRRTGEFLPRP